MTKDTLEIIKQKDDYEFSVEIKENSKGEPTISVKVKSDESPKATGDKALAEYRRLKQELSS